MQPLRLILTLCYAQLTAVKTRYLLTIIVGSGEELLEVAYFLKLPADQVMVFHWTVGTSF